MKYSGEIITPLNEDEIREAVAKLKAHKVKEERVRYTNSICVDKSVPMEMRDGTVLRADIYRPDDRQKHPAILVRIPYDKQGVLYWAFLPLFDAILAGDAVVIQSQRGMYDSEGEHRLNDISLTIERLDGYGTVKWVASQTLRDGNIGPTAGASYMGLNQWLTARERPPYLMAKPVISSLG